MKGEISLADALERVESSSIKGRTEGLADLKHVLRANNRFETLSDASFHKIYEVLFRLTVSEQSAALKPKTSLTKSAAENRLSACAAALRASLEKGVRIIKLKTTLVLANGSFCEPIALDYAKGLRALLSYQAHVEHLEQEQRERLALFCLECVNRASSDSDDGGDAEAGAEAISVSGTLNGHSYRSSRSQFKESAGSQGGRSLGRQIVEEMVACLGLLTAPANTRSGPTLSTILWGQIELLKRSTSNARSHTDVFGVINNILALSRTENIELTRKVTIPLVRLVRVYWPVKSSLALKDEMLKTLLYLRPYLASALAAGDITARSETKGLLDVVKSEYSKRQEKEQLHLEDLRLHFGHADAHQIGLSVFSLRCGNTRAEANWVTVHMLASLHGLLSACEDEKESDEEEDINPRPRKRLKLTNEIGTLMSTSTNDPTPSRLCTLQLMAFTAQQARFSGKRIGISIDGLSPSCTDENPIIASWAMLALTSLASQITASEERLSSRWASVWQLASRAMNNASTCRAACQLLLAMLKASIPSQQNIAELTGVLTHSIDVNGPASLADSVAHLLTQVLRTAQQVNPTSATATAKSALNWLFRNFSPSMFEDKRYASLHILLEPADVVQLIVSCLGQSGHRLTTPQFPTWMSVGSVWLSCEKQESLLEYLLLLPKPALATHDLSNLSDTSLVSLPNRAGCETNTLDHLIADLRRAQDTWSPMMREKPLSISVDMFTYLCSSVSAAICVAYCNSFRDQRRQDQLQRQAHSLLDQLVEFVPSRDCGQDKVDSMLMTFSSACSKLFADTYHATPCKCEVELCKAIHQACERRRSQEDSKGAHSQAAMDFDDEYDSQDSRQGQQTTTLPDLKHEAAASYSVLAMRSSVTMYAAAVSRLEQELSPPDSGSASMVDYVLSLPRDTILSGRCVVARLPEIGVSLLSDEVERLLEFCTEEFLQAYAYERSEVATGVLLDIMSSLAPQWTSPTQTSLYDLGIDMYVWYTKTALTGGILSPSAQRRVATLLLQLCHGNTDYGYDDDVPSPRTSLFKLLQLGSITVLFHVADQIPSLFGLFVLSNHAPMFDDLQESLPSTTDWVEGMAMRLLFYQKLASAWRSLLRQSVYYIFETAGLAKETSKHAARCATDLSEALGLGSPQELFHLFAPQLLHTWLESRKITDLPFAVFQYESLEALIMHNRSELTAQLLVRSNEDGMQVAAAALKMESPDLVMRSFAQCRAYGIAMDSRKFAGSNEDTCEARLRKLIGKEALKTFTVAQAPAILGQFYLSLQQDDVDPKWSEKRKEYAPATNALSEMKSISHSERFVPDSQQPNFRSRYLFDQIERLCRRTSQNSAQPLDASSFSLAARMLLDSICDALGPLHTCLIIRKLRLLIAMSGDVPFSGFPLEMLVHTLRPYLSDSQCADDVIGILQYLFNHGRQYLRAQPSFLFGTITLIILRMRKHSVARQESTTQESQHRQTVQRMQAFQTWLVDYLRKCTEHIKSRTLAMYSSLTDSLGRVRLPGNAHKDSPESSLILMLLDDGTAEIAAFSSADRDEALVMLSENFDPPSSPSEDCLSGDHDCVRLAHSVWTAMHIPGVDDNFISWAASVVGRAYASTGLRPVSRHSSDKYLGPVALEKYEGVGRSVAAIANRLSAMLYSRKRQEASLADHTLRSVVQSFTVAEEAITFEQMLPSTIVPAFIAGPYGYVPDFAALPSDLPEDPDALRRILASTHGPDLSIWVRQLSLALCRRANEAAVLPALQAALRNDVDLAMELLPYIVHILLAQELDQEQVLRSQLSTAFATHLRIADEEWLPRQRYILKLLSFLRSQQLPNETTDADRLRWLEIDWVGAARAAERCGMHTMALMFAESASQASGGPRRSSSRASLSQISIAQIPRDLLLSIFKAVEEPDSYYGVEQPAALESVLERLDYEDSGYKSLMFRSAQTNNDIQRFGKIGPDNSRGMVHSLSLLNLDSLNFALLSNGYESAKSSTELMETARRLQQWDVVAPEQETSGAASCCFSAFRELSRAVDYASADRKLGSIIVTHTKSASDRLAQSPSSDFLSALAVLVETRGIVASRTQDSFRICWEEVRARQAWMKMAPFEDFRLILSCRQTLLSIMAQNKVFGDVVGSKQSRKAEIESLVDIAQSARQHGHLQEALTAMSQLNNSVRSAEQLGVKANTVALVETASVLWQSDEAVASVQMLRDALEVRKTGKEDISVDQPGLLAQLAHQLAEARLEKPDDILSAYLQPAVNGLQGREMGEEAGKVFHEFATFCDRQLQNPANADELSHITKLRLKKWQDVQDLQPLAKNSKPNDNETRKAYNQAKSWYALDDAEYQRLTKTRDTFLEQSLQNYMLALCASDEHDISVLRFFALWLEYSEAPNVNEVVEVHLHQVPTWKFVVLMNQLMPRLLQDKSTFQTTLKKLVRRICAEHPHHSLHHLYAATRSPKATDEAAVSRYQVAAKIRTEVQGLPKVGPFLKSVFCANGLLNKLAWATPNEQRSNSQVALQDMPDAFNVSNQVPRCKVPPTTFSVPIRPNGSYDDIPFITKYRPAVRIMTGNSHPKRLDAIASNGRTYIELFKSGDDLRQDAIMEQIFGEVSKMLHNHKTTRQRNLHVRTYSVVPLSSQSGVIEFVPNSVSLTDYLSPAHQRYHPQDYKYGTARDKIAAVAGQTTDTRVKEYRKVCDHLQPVLRHFFFERFKDPDEWFAKRTAYTRTTAAISILGHVLGLGDRHCQNIMLDEKTGEVVHIDLGIAFEGGKVLPVPEKVPFRLSRDVVDGMGITKTEGVFRRCCELTMDALRDDKDSIMTLLNVLRYDPLHVWTVSPLRAKRMQEQVKRSAAEGDEGSGRKKDQEAGDADRALSVVEKKLSKNLSTAATVNELIQQATDERNLATLFVGWSAFY
ncbi:Serine/threonine-protein kinase tel1 [Saxophila tyrrhenica]|uniref:Serine/threonine-protein kinase Tel1 n=1 Tax=Saxophila tyrrhenica TaxID=1690608 RepID=A0AAV9P4Q0_9PEZI|nr:Serine/threonine-protein kinase tel1 [Saxophila tyrrhenica]